MREWVRFDAVVRLVLGAVLPLAVAVALVPLRDEMATANVALTLMAAVVVAAAVGGRLAGVVAAVVSALSYDLLHTQPYLSLRMSVRDDVETTLLLLLAGLIVGTIASRGRLDRAAAEAGRSEIRRIYRLAEQVVADEDPADVIMAAEAELTTLMGLKTCRFEAGPGGGLPRLDRAAFPVVEGHRSQQHPRAAVELPEGGAELQVLSRGQSVGRFVLVPTPGRALSLEQRVVAVALADQVGAAFAAYPSALQEASRRG